jgi:hypothetical protein
MLSQIAIITLTLSAPGTGLQGGFGGRMGPYTPQPENVEWAGLSGGAVEDEHAGEPHCRPSDSYQIHAEVRHQGPSPRLPAITGQYQLDGGFYVREVGPNPPERVRSDGPRNS